MKAMLMIVVLGVVGIAYGLPMNDLQGRNLITGVFIPSDAFKNLQDRVNANSPNNQQPIQGNNPVQNLQQVLTNQPTMSNQPMSNQPNVVYTQQPLTANRDPNQPIMVMTNQPNNQPSQPIVLVQQPSQSSNQPIYVQQPNQQPNQMIIATNPSNGNQMQGTLVQLPNQNQPGSTVYTLIPLNGQNNNMNTNSGGSYLIPAQSGNSNPIILSTGK